MQINRGLLLGVVAVIALIVLLRNSSETFRIKGWLEDYDKDGDWDWIEKPSWQNDDEKAEVAPPGMKLNLFTRDRPLLVALDNVLAKESPAKLSRLSIKNAKLLMDKPSAKDLPESLNEVWAIELQGTGRFRIRSGNGNHLAVDDMKTCERVWNAPALAFDDWLIKNVLNTNTYQIYTRPCKDGKGRRYLGYKNGNVDMIEEGDIAAAPKAVLWNLKPIIEIKK